MVIEHFYIEMLNYFGEEVDMDSTRYSNYFHG